MIYLWLLVIAIFGALVLCLFAPLKIDIQYRENKITIKLKCMGFRFTIDERLFRKNKDKKNIKKAKDSDSLKVEDVKKQGIMKKINTFKEGYKSFSGVISDVLSRVQDHAEFSGIYLRIRYGTGDAAITGMIYGAIWAIAGSMHSLLSRFFKVDFPEIELEPVFSGKAFEIEAEGIIKTRLVHIITAAFCSVRIYQKHKKEKGAN